jgi:SOS-response transcriptional repressor LexA
MRRKRRDILELAEDRMKNPIPVKKVRKKRQKVEGLTERQAECLRMIKVFMKVRGFSPCLQEIAESMGMKSRANIYRIVGELEKKGYLSTKPYLARTIKLKDERSVKQG